MQPRSNIFYDSSYDLYINGNGGFVGNYVGGEVLKNYLVNYKNRSIEEKFQIKTNHTNCIEINNKLIKPEIFLVTEKYLGIPMYVSVKNNFLSFEHTHPPHEYILSDNKFLKVANLKKEINEIIN